MGKRGREIGSKKAKRGGGQLCIEAVDQFLCPWLTQQLLKARPHLAGGGMMERGRFGGEEGEGQGG